MSPFISYQTTFAFKKIFGSPGNTDILISFLNAILYDGKPTIQSLTVLDPYQAPRIQGIEDSYLDVRATLDKGQNVIVEMQVLNFTGHEERTLYNAAQASSTQHRAEDAESRLDPVIALTITEFEMFERSHDAISRYRLRDKREITSYGGDIELVFVELPKVNKSIEQLSTLTDKWLFFLKEVNQLESVPTSLDEESAIHNAFELARNGCLTRDEMEVIGRQSMVIHDRRNAILFAKQQGFQKGLKKGQRIAKIAQLLLDKLPAEEIAKITGLSLDEIEQLRKSKPDFA